MNEATPVVDRYGDELSIGDQFREYPGGSPVFTITSIGANPPGNVFVGHKGYRARDVIKVESMGPTEMGSIPVGDASERLKTFLTDGASAYFRADSKASMSADIASVLAELDALRNPWQPIETAVKSELLDLWSDGRRYTDCHWDNRASRWERYGVNIGGGTCWLAVDNPTHWMQPPSGPLAKHGAATGETTCNQQQ